MFSVFSFQRTSTRESNKFFSSIDSNPTLKEKVRSFVSALQEEVQQRVSEKDYRAFDALVKNNGCQLTALRVFQLLQKESFSQEEEAELARLRLLALVNVNEVKNEREVPCTQIDKINVIGSFAPNELNVMNQGVRALQFEEAKRAVVFIQEQARQLKGDRGDLLQRALQQVRTSKSSPIQSVPLFYNTETVMKTAALAQGLFLLKNKLYLGLGRIAGAEKKECYVRLSMKDGKVQETLLGDDELSLIPGRTPVIVVEAYIRSCDSLAEKVRQYGLERIILTSGAFCPQYASTTASDPLEEEFEKELQVYKQDRALSEEIEVEHIFCASFQQVRGEE